MQRRIKHKIHNNKNIVKIIEKQALCCLLAQHPRDLVYLFIFTSKMAGLLVAWPSTTPLYVATKFYWSAVAL